uniref:Uncharacterized protein n=1 Tax=Knipowitschia caucasica TaxID=637954 RepID=A0AAV2L7B6_KNICA
MSKEPQDCKTAPRRPRDLPEPKQQEAVQEPQSDRHLIDTSPVLQKLTSFEEAIGVLFTHVRLLARAFTLRTEQKEQEEEEQQEEEQQEEEQQEQKEQEEEEQQQEQKEQKEQEEKEQQQEEQQEQKEQKEQEEEEEQQEEQKEQEEEQQQEEQQQEEQQEDSEALTLSSHRPRTKDLDQALRVQLIPSRPEPQDLKDFQKQRQSDPLKLSPLISLKLKRRGDRYSHLCSGEHGDFNVKPGPD